MRWDFIIEHWTALLLADAALVSVMGSASGWIYPADSSKPVRTPSIQYTLLYDTEGELWNRVGVQADLFIRGKKKAAQVERRVRILTHHDTAVELGGERLWMRFQDARAIEFPSDAEVVHRALDFEFEAVRGKYASL